VAAIGLVLAAELRVQQPLFRTYAGDERRDKERCEKHADSGTKGERPAQRIDEQTQIARVADGTIETSRDQRMPGLMATNPLNRRPSTKTGQIRSTPPPAKRTTPSQRMASPSRVQNSFRSV
jgi:hypothetical protein